MIDELLSEVSYRFSRSSGPGGQSVNKVSTRVELIFDLDKSKILNEYQKERISNKLKTRKTSEGVILLACDETRSQLKNREIVIRRFLDLIEESLAPIKKRKPTKPTKASNERRLTNKKKISNKKKDRKPEID